LKIVFVAYFYLFFKSTYLIKIDLKKWYVGFGYCLEFIDDEFEQSEVGIVNCRYIFCLTRI